MTPPPVASYRLQLTPERGLAHAIAVLDHLVALGVSHLYLSPVAEAVPGSGHGYDVVDHTRVRAEIGGAAELDRLLDAAGERGIAVVVDHVPNHASTARPELNAPWWEMLRDGPEAPGARWFDVDWAAGGGQVVLPVLGAPLDDVVAAGQVAVVRHGELGPELLVHGALRLPLATGTADLPLGDLLERQHYRLTWWRDPERNVRRFFTIDDLVAVRVEDPDVAATIDRLPAGLAAHPAFGGVRVDHVDGLADPLAYLAGLRRRVGADAWVVVEKILAVDEQLPPGWPVDGTTGYEFARVLDQTMMVPGAASTFDRSWVELAATDPRLGGSFGDVERRARHEVLAAGLLPDVERTWAAAERALGPLPGLRDSLVEITVRLPRYRTYLPDDQAGAAVLTDVGAEVARDEPHLAEAVARLVDALLAPSGEADAELRTRWQQLTGPAMAKGAEDRAFYRYLRFPALCEVGGDPGRFGGGVDELHAANAAAQGSHPLTMLAASTHDTKRSADVRARAAALTAAHTAWAAAVERWLPTALAEVDGIDAPTASLALQTAATCPALDADRLAAFLVKSTREADMRTSWAEPDEAYEASLTRLAGVVVGDHEVARSLARFARRLDGPGAAAAVAATLVRHTAPGVPDVYQGTEAFSYRLVDPDNRHPPDWAALAGLVREAARLDALRAWRTNREASKAVVMARASALRRRHPEAFGAAATYRPLAVQGPGADRVVAFARGDGSGDVAVTIVGLPGLAGLAGDRAGEPAASDLGSDRAGPSAELAVELPAGWWHDVLVDGAPPVEGGRLPLARRLAAFPGVLLERSPDPDQAAT